MFKVPVEPQFEQKFCTKRHHSSHTTEAGNEACVRKRERIELERASMASLVDEEIRQMRELEMVVTTSIYVLVRGVGALMMVRRLI